jgi:ribosomal protein S18 acetylase RimI-like enzyme
MTIEPLLPAGYTARPVEDADVPAIARFVNQESLALTGDVSLIEEEYLSDISGPHVDRACDTRAVLDGNGAVVAVADVGMAPPYVMGYPFVRVAGTHQGRGIGWALTAWCEARAHVRLEGAPAGAAVHLEAWNYSSCTPALTLLADAGYEPGRRYHTMILRLDAPLPEPAPPPGIQFFSLEERPDVDLRAVHSAEREAFSDHYGYVETDVEEAFDEWWHDLTGSLYDPGLKFLAMDGAEIAAICFCVPPAPGPTDAAWVNQVGVRRAYRKQGLARALLLHGFATLRRRGAQSVGLTVDSESLTGATRLYESVGMQVLRTSVTYTKLLRPGQEYAVRQLSA